MSGHKRILKSPPAKCRKPAEILARWGDDKHCTWCPVDLSDMHAGWKPESEFYKSSTSPDGAYAICMTCARAATKATRAEDGGMSKVERRLYNEDQWLHQCYKMLENTGLSVTGANARRLFQEVLPADHHCPSCDKLMVSTSGAKVGSNPKRTAVRSNAPSVEHVVPKSHPLFMLFDEWEVLRVICWECNMALGNASPDLLYKAADWRYKVLESLGINKHLMIGPNSHEDTIRHRDRRAKPDGDTPAIHDGHVRQYHQELQRRHAEGWLRVPAASNTANRSQHHRFRPACS